MSSSYAQEQSIFLPATSFNVPSDLSASQRNSTSPPGLGDSSMLFTSEVSPTELAVHQASNFKNVKGVYKNCRGIWAAQWTDERGQRHTKYFNPKYFQTEAAARHEAFCFKIRIAREIELRGGVKKKRALVMPMCPTNSLDLIFRNPRERRSSRVPRKAYGSSSRFMNGPPLSQPDSSLSLSTFAGASHNENHFAYDQLQMNALPGQLYPEEYQRTSEMSEYTPTEGSGLASQLESYSSRSQSPNPKSMSLSTQFYPSSDYTQNYYQAATLDALYGSSSLYEVALQGSSPLQPSLSQQCAESNSAPHGSSSTNAGKTLLTPNYLSPLLSKCLCGCASLAVYPAQYASHHLVKHHSQECSANGEGAQLNKYHTEDTSCTTPADVSPEHPQETPNAADVSSSDVNPFSILNSLSVSKAPSDKLIHEVKSSMLLPSTSIQDRDVRKPAYTLSYPLQHLHRKNLSGEPNIEDENSEYSTSDHSET